MESINASAFFSIVIGRNCFCCLCFKTVADSAVHMEDEIALVQNDQKSIEAVVVADLLIEVLGEQLYNQLSSFDAICNLCLSSAIKSFKFIRKCKNNVQNLCKVLDNFSMGIKDAFTGIRQGYRAAYVSVDTKRYKWNRYYSRISFQCRPKAYEKFILIEKQQKLVEYKKRAQVKKKLLKVNVIRLEDYIIKNCTEFKQNQTENTGCKFKKNKSIRTYKPKPKILQQNNHKNNQKLVGLPQYICVNESNDAVSGICRLKSRPNRKNNNKDTKRLIEYPEHLPDHTNEINVKDSSNINRQNETLKKPLHNGILEEPIVKNFTEFKQNQTENTGSKINKNKSTRKYKPKPMILQQNNHKNNQKLVGLPQYICVNESNDAVNGICRLKSRPNILRKYNNKDTNRLIEYLEHLPDHTNEINVKDGININRHLNKPLYNGILEEPIEIKLSETNSDHLQSQVLITDIEIKQLDEFEDETDQCQY